jgi:hypothetical protein
VIKSKQMSSYTIVDRPINKIFLPEIQVSVGLRSTGIIYFNDDRRPIIRFGSFSTSLITFQGVKITNMRKGRNNHIILTRDDGKEMTLNLGIIPNGDIKSVLMTKYGPPVSRVLNI